MSWSQSTTTVNISGAVETPGVVRPGINLGGLGGYGSQQLFKSLNYVTGGYFPGTYAGATFQCNAGGSNTTTSWYNNITNQPGYPANFWVGATFDAINAATGTSYGSGTITASTTNSGATGTTLTLSPAINSACNPSQNDVLIVRLTAPNTLLSPYQVLNNHVCTNAVWNTSDTSPASTNTQQSLQMPSGCDLTFYIDALVTNRTNTNPALASQAVNFINLNGSYNATFKAKCLTNGCNLNFTLGRLGKTTFVGNTTVFPFASGTSGQGWTTYTYPFTASETGGQDETIGYHFTCTGTCLVQDADVIEGSTLPGNTTVFRDAVVYELQKIHPGSIRYMDASQWCSDVADEIASMGNRRWCGASNYNPGVGQPIGYNDVLALANFIGSDVILSVGQLNQPADWTMLINWLNSSGWISTYAQSGHTIYLEDGNEAWNSAASASFWYGTGTSYGYTLGKNMAAARAAAGYNSSVIKLVGNSFAAGEEGYGQFGWIQNTLTVAQRVPNGLPDFVDDAPYMLNYLGNFDTSGSNVATTGAPFLDEWAEDTNIDSVTSPPLFSTSMYLNQQYAKANFGVNTLVYEVNESTTSGIAASQLQLDQIDASVGNALSTAQHVLLMQRDSQVTGPIDVFTLAEPYTGYNCNGCGSITPLWGANLFMATGPGQTPGIANVDRPLAIALEVINNAIGSNNNLMSTAQTGTPTFNYPGGQVQGSSNSISPNSAVPYVNCFSYSNGVSAWTTICFNNNLTTAELVTLTGAGAPTGSVTETVFPGSSNVITDHNENTYLGVSSIAPVVTLPSAITTSGTSYSIPPASMITLTYTSGGTTPTTLATPIFSPGAGTYSSAQTVTITFPAGATGCVGINTVPTAPTPGTCGPGGTTYGAPITVSSSETVNAIATAVGSINSAAGTAVYTISTVLPTPTFSPGGGTYTVPLPVTISDAAAGTTLYYTTDGTTPTTSSSVYSGPITVSSSGTLRAIAVETGFTTSSVGTAAYIINPGGGGTTYISLASGQFTASSFYLNGGSTVTQGGVLQVTDGLFSEDRSAWFSTQVPVGSFATDFTFQLVNASADGMTFVIQGQGPAALGVFGAGLGYQGIPNSVAIKFDLFNNSGEGSNSTGLYTGGVVPTIPAVDLTPAGINLRSGDTMDAHIVYDGSNLTMTLTDIVTGASVVEVYPVNIPAAVGGPTAYVGFTGSTGSFTAIQNVLTWSYVSPAGPVTPTAATPTFSPGGGTYTSSQPVTISDTTAGTTIYYTTNGTTPTTSSSVYSGPITVSSSETLEAIAVENGYTNSAAATAAYTINIPTAATPTFSPGGGTYTTSQSVTISDTTAGTTIYYTTNGTTPTTSSSVYGGPITVSSSETLQAIAVKSGFTTSATGTAAYTISPVLPTPTFAPGGGTYTTSQPVTISDSTAGTTIYYTTNGTTPTTSSSVYSGPLTVSSSETLQAIAVESGFTNSPVASAAYTISLISSPTVISTACYQGSSSSSLTIGPLNTTGANAIAIAVASFNVISSVTDNMGNGKATGLTAAGGSPNNQIFYWQTPAVGNGHTITINGNSGLYASACVFVMSGVNGAYSGVQNASSAGYGSSSCQAGSITPPSGPQVVIAGFGIYAAGGAPTIDSLFTLGAYQSGTPGSAYGEAAGYLVQPSGTAINPKWTWSNNATTPSCVIAAFSGGSIAPAAATPTFSPTGGTYTSSQPVTISDATPGTTIYYTTNGTTPTTSSNIYSAPITVSASETLQAIAVETGFTNSAAATAAYTINPVLPAPSFSPGGGTYTTSQPVTISDSTAGTTIYYTTNGTTPTTSSSVYSGPITVSSSETLQAIAVETGYTSSAAATAAYTINIPTAATPTFSPSGGNYTTSQSVTISDTTAGTTIYYTTNGTTPTTSSSVYSGPIAVSSSETLQAIAVESGYTNSAAATAAYTISPVLPTPTFSPGGGTYTSSQPVTISDTTAGTTIYYTTNGTTPTTSSSVYSGPITVSSSETLEAIAVENGYTNSAAATAAYTINIPTAATPTFSPGGGTYTTSQSVTISDTTAGTTIYYTTNGTTPTTSSSVYGGPITVSSSETLQAIAVKSGFTTSATGTAAYTISPVLPTPTFAPGGGTYTTSQPVTISDSTAGTTIYYTTNGTTPTTSSSVYSGPLTVSSSETLQAIAVESGFTNSPVASAAYTISLISSPTVISTACYQGSSSSSLTIGPLNTTGANAIAIAVASFNVISSVTDNMGNGKATGLTAAGGSPNNQIFYWQTPAVGNGHTITINGNSGLYASACVFVMSGVNGAYSGVQNASSAGYGSSSCQAGSITPPSGPQVVIAGFGVYAAGGAPTIDSLFTLGAYQSGTPGSAYGEAAGYLVQPSGTAINPKWTWSNNATTPSCVIAAFSGGSIAPAAATPTFSPTGGTYTSSQPVTISDATPGTTIYYTTNGTTPTTSSNIYSAPITVSASETLQAIAVETGFTNSAAATAAYTINPVLPAPSFSPGGGTYTTSQPVTISDSTAGTTIYYTTNGTTPTTSSSVYSGPITVSSSEILQAIAVETGYTSSAAATAAYTINIPTAATPTFSPSGGNYTTSQSVTISDTTAGTTIYYTTNGTTPTTSSSVYSGPIAVSSSETLEAIAVEAGYANSSAAVAAYTINSSSGGSTSYIALANGQFTASAFYLNGGSAVTSGGVLQVTDGLFGEDRSAWFKTQVPVGSFATDFTFQLANASADGMTFAIQGQGPTALGSFGPGLGYQGIPNSVAIKFDLFNNSGEGSNSTGLYTGGAVPSIPATDLTSSGINLHSGDIMDAHMVYDGTNLTMTLTDTITTASVIVMFPVNIPAVVGSSTAYVGFTGSTGTFAAIDNVLTWTYVSPAGPAAPLAATPTFSPGSGTYSSSQPVTISDTTAGTTIYYTTNGTTPSPSTSAVYGGPISVNSSETLEAIAVEAGYTNSAVGTAIYTISVPAAATPTFSPAGGAYSSSQSVTISDTTASTTIYYTTNGTTPTTTSSVYSGPVTVGSTETLEAVAVAPGFANSSAGIASYTLPSGSPPTVTTACYEGSNSSTLTLGPLNTTGANAIAIAVASFNDIASVIDNMGNGRATALTPTTGGSPNNQIFYWRTPAVGTGHTITINGNSGLYASACVFVMSGVTGDYSGVQNSASASYGSTSCQAGSITPPSGPQVIIAGFGVYSPTGSPSIDRSFTLGGYQPGVPGSFGEAAGYIIQPAGAPTNPIWNWGNTATSPSCVIAAFGGGTGARTAAFPTFSPGGGNYTSSQLVTISDTTPGKTIYYTTNGTTPTTSSSVYSGPITVSATETLEAIAVEAGYSNSIAATAAYTINPLLPSVTLSGSVHGGTQPISSSVVQLYAVGSTGVGSVATPLLTQPATSDAAGNFSFTSQYTCPSSGAEVYLTANGGNPGLTQGTNNPAISLIAALGPCGNLTSSTYANIDEVTTIGAVWSLAPYMKSYLQVGDVANSIPLENGFVTSSMLTNVATGQPSQPYVSQNDYRSDINTLADALTLCVTSNGSTAPNTPCANLFSAATPSNSVAPTNTSAAALNIANSPTQNISSVYHLVPVPAAAPFQPSDSLLPTDWSLGFSSTIPTTFSASLNSESVFMGDSITAGWTLPNHNSGLSGQHTAQILSRFQTDIINPGYARVIILAGTNDIWHPDPSSSYALTSLQSMTDMADQNGVQVVLCLLPPMNPTDVVIDPQAVINYNAGIRSLAQRKGYLLIDYYTPLLGHPELFNDGVHPTAAGYVVMQTALASVITR